MCQQGYNFISGNLKHAQRGYPKNNNKLTMLHWFTGPYKLITIIFEYLLLNINNLQITMHATRVHYTIHTYDSCVHNLIFCNGTHLMLIKNITSRYVFSGICKCSLIAWNYFLRMAEQHSCYMVCSCRSSYSLHSLVYIFQHMWMKKCKNCACWWIGDVHPLTLQFLFTLSVDAYVLILKYYNVVPSHGCRKQVTFKKNPFFHFPL